jgi:ribosomal protein L29
MIALELRQRSDEELASLEQSLTEDLFHFRMQNSVGQPDMGRIRNARRDLARVKTVMRERGIHSRVVGRAVERREAGGGDQE